MQNKGIRGIHRNLESLDKKVQQTNRLKKAIQNYFASLPQNPLLKPFGKSGRTFVIKASDLKLNFSPEYHDFCHQYRTINSILATTPGEKVRDVLSEIVRSKTAHCFSHDIKLHPDVLKNIQNVLVRTKKGKRQPVEEIDNGRTI
jgi:hypothetical protein